MIRPALGREPPPPSGSYTLISAGVRSGERGTADDSQSHELRGEPVWSIADDILAENPIAPQTVSGVGVSFLACRLFDSTPVVSDPRDVRVKTDPAVGVCRRGFRHEGTIAVGADLPCDLNPSGAMRALFGRFEGPHRVVGVGEARNSVSSPLGLTPDSLKLRRVCAFPLWGPHVIHLGIGARIPLAPLFFPCGPCHPHEVIVGSRAVGLRGRSGVGTR